MRGTFSYEPRLECICGSVLAGDLPVIEKTFAWGPVRFVRCGRCASWCQSPQIVSSALAAWFDSPEYHGAAGRPGVAYVNYAADEPARRREARFRVHRHLGARLGRPGRVLEVGCATGALLSVLREEGWDVAGVDLSIGFAAAARSLYDLDVAVGDLRHVDLEAAAFDAVIMLGTFAALSTLHEQLLRVRSLLKPNGVFVCNFPDAASPVVRYLYRSRFWMFTPSVSCFMTVDGATRALHRAGFRVESVSPDVQRPSLFKLLSHANLRPLARIVDLAGIGGAGVPVLLPSLKLLAARLMPTESAG